MILVEKMVSLIRDRKGDLPAGVWVIGAAVVSVMMILALIKLAPTTATNFWNTLSDYATTNFGL